MAYPVDILTNVDHQYLELAAEEYMSQLPCRNPDTAEYLSLPDSKQIEIEPGNVSFVPLYGADTTKKLLALFSPDFTTVVGLYLLGQWWGVEDVLKTAEPSRTGLIKVSTLGERIVLYVLNRIVLRNEKSSEDVSFLCHCDHESAKILWKDGEAIGFYSYKPKGSLCRNFLTQCYQLPVMDTVFVRKCHRGKGHGIKILEDFVGSFREEYIGLKFPLSEAMYKVCEKYFSIYPADKEILWEVEKIGSPFQRTLIANRLQKLKLKAEKDQVVSKLKFDEDDVTAPMEIEITKVQETTEYTVEIVEETITDIPKEVDDIPVTRRGRGSNLKRRGIRENSEERLSTNIIRVEDIEAGVESPIEVATEENLDDTFSVKEPETVLRSTTDKVIATVTNISELRISQKEKEQEIEKDTQKVTATSEGTPVIHLTTAGEIKSQRGSEEECEMVHLEHNVIQGATIGSIDQSQLQSVVDIEIVKMSTATEEEQNENLEENKEVEEDKPVCEAEEEEIKQMLDEPEEEKAVSGTVETYNNTEALEEVTDQSETLANKAEAESEVEEYKEKEELTVETDSSMDAEITQVGETVDVVPEISEIDQEEAPQQSSVESAEVHKLKTTPEEDEETVENSSKMLTLCEAKVVLVDLHKLSPKEASDDNNREIDIAVQDEMKHTVSSEQQAAEEIIRMEEQDGTLGTTEGYNLETDAKRTPEQSTGYKEQGKPEPETEEVVPLSQVEKPEEKTNTEQAKKDAQKRASTDIPSRSTSLRDQPVDPGVTVRCLRSTLKPIEITPVRRSTRSKAVIQQVESVEPQNEAKFRTDAEDVGPEESEKANTNVDETVVIESGSSELLKATEIDTKEKTPQITEATEGDIPFVQAEPDEDVTEKVKEIKKMENEEANLSGHTDIGIEKSSLAQEKDVQEEEAAVSTERSLRRRTIRVRSPLRRKPRHVQKQEAEADIEHRGRHTVVTKNKTESISVTEERVEEMDQEVNKMENKEANLSELEPGEEPDMIRNEDKKASTEETMNVCLQIVTTETSFESLDDTANTVETAAVDTEKSELLMGVEIDDQEKEAGPDEETEIEDGTPVIKLQKATVVLVDFSKLTQNTEEAGTPEVLKHSQMEEHLELDEPDKREQELCNLASEEEKQKEEIQTQDTEMIPVEEKLVKENTVEEQNKLDKQDMTFEEEKPTEDLATMPAQSNLVESTKNENNQNEDEGVNNVPQEKEKTEIVTEKSADKVNQEGTEIDKEKAPKKSTVEATEKVIPFVEAEPEEDVVEKEAKEINNMENIETNLAVTKDTNEEAPEMGEEANLEQQKNEPLVKNEKETAETEKPMEVDPAVSKEQTYVVEGTTTEIEEVSQVESTGTNQSDNAKITRRSSRLSAKSVTSTQNTRKSTRLHKAELEPVKEADMIRNESKEYSATTEGTVTVCIPIITVETNLESPDEIPNTNVEKTSAVGPETSVLLMGVETEDKEAPKILQEVTLEAEPDEEVEKDDVTPIIQLQKATVVLVDLNKLSQSTEGKSDTPEVLAHSQTEEQLELDEPDKSEYQLRIQTSEHTEKTREEEEDKMEEVNSVEVQNKLDKQEMTFEGQKLIEVLEEQNDVKETEIVEEYKAVIDEDVEEAVTSIEHPEAATMADKTNIIKETENDKDIALKEKRTDSDVEMSSRAQEAPEAVQEILEEEVPVSTERILRHRKIKVQSPPRRKSRRVQNQEAEADVEHQERHTVVTKNKTEAVSEETVEEIDVNMKNEEASLAELEPVEEDTEKVAQLVEGEPEEDVIEKGFEEINKMVNKETSLENDAAPEMGRDEASLEHHEKESLVKNDKETAESEKHMEMDTVPLVCKAQTYVIEETTIQVEEKVSQMESTENKSERITRRGLRISAQSATFTQKTRKSPHLHTAELEPEKEGDMSRNEGTLSTTAETMNVCVPIITAETNMESLDEDGDSMSRKVETTLYEQERDISTAKGKVDEALPDKATDEQDETKSSTQTTENEIMVEMDKTQKVVEGGVQDDEKAEPPQQDTDQKLEENVQEKGEDEVRTSSVEEDTTQQKEAVSKEENVGETNPTNEFKTTAVEGKIALESSDQETPLIIRSLRYRTVTVQSTPRRKSKWLHRQEVESEKETKDNICRNEIDSAIQESADDLNIPIEKENEAFNAEENITEFENLETKEGGGIIQVNIEGKVEETGTKEDTVEEENEILFEINESNSASPENTEQGKTQEENLERDVQVPKEQEEEEKPLQEKENVGAVEGSSFDLVETAVEMRTLRKRVTVETSAPRKSKRLRKQEHDEDSEQVKEAVMGQTETVEVMFTADNVELSSEVPAAVFEGSNLGGEIQQNISEGTKSDGDCNIHEDTKTDAGEAQEEQKEKRVNKPQTDEDKKEVMELNSKKVEETGEMEKVIEKHVETEEQKLESSTNKGFTLELEAEETSDQEENNADKETRVAMEAPKDICTSAEKFDEGEENISDEDEKGLASEKHVLQSSSIASSSRRRSMRLQIHESKKNTTEDESDSEESEAQQTAKHQRKRKAITDLTPARRSKRYVREKNV